MWCKNKNGLFPISTLLDPLSLTMVDRVQTLNYKRKETSLEAVDK